jgi:lysylphosphatidylglycerol synthetase-like protein (DUF2156 family)
VKRLNYVPLNETTCAIYLALSTIFFVFMPIIGLIIILIQGWNNTSEFIKVLWILSIIVMGCIILYAGFALILKGLCIILPMYC